MYPTSRRRAAFNLLEIMIGMFILGLGMMMIAGSLPMALKSTSDSADLTASTLVARSGAQRVLATGGDINFPGNGGAMSWYGPSQDQYLGNGSSVNSRPWLVNDPANWGVAIPYPADPRYAYQILYRRRGAAAPFDWDIFVVVQTQRDGVFQPPVGPLGISKMGAGDVYCDNNGVWRRYAAKGGAGLVFGIPGSVMIYQSSMRF